CGESTPGVRTTSCRPPGNNVGGSTRWKGRRRARAGCQTKGRNFLSMSTTMEHVVEVTDETFERTVIEGSSERPVVVDLWAAWCGPCRTLGPMLERVAAEREGAFLLAKLDVDANGVGQSLLQAVRSQGIPTVVAFRDGQPVSMFIGAYPEEEVNRFIDSILPTGAELDAKEAEQAAESGDVAGAERGFRDALAEDPDNGDAALGLAKLLIDRGEFEEARTLVAKHLPEIGRASCRESA